jgi:hypothetical protein
MKDRSTLVILIGIILVGAFIWAQEGWLAKNASKRLEHIRLFNLDAETLLSIEFSMSNRVVRCVKESGVWMASDDDGHSGRADEALIQRMVSGLNSMGKGTTITGKQLSLRGIDTAEYGFTEPAVTITAVDNKGRQSWLVGRNTALGDMVYAKAQNAEDIFTISNKLLLIIPGTSDVLRDRVLFPGDATGVRRVEVRGPAGFVQLVKDPQEGWRIQQPVAARADEKEVNLYLEKLYRFRIIDFVADNVSDLSIYGLQGETGQISLGQMDGSSRMVVIGDDIPDRPGFVYGRRADGTSVFSLSGDILQQLNVPAERFRDAGVLSVPPGSISSIRIMHGENQLDLAYDGSTDWKITSPMVWDADPKAISDFVTLWVNAVVTEFDVNGVSDDPEWTIEFGSAASGTTNRLEIFSTIDKEGLLIRRDDDPAFYRINLPMVPTSIINPLVYKSRKVMSLNAEDINKITLWKGAENRQVIERTEDQAFVPVSTNGNVRVDDQALDKLLNRLRRVDTAGYVIYNPRDLDIYGLAHPAAELQLGLSDTNRLGQVMLIGSETSDGFYSMIKGRDVIFYLEKPMVDILTANLFQDIEGLPSAAD